jgi:hypothetical protein
MRLIKDGRDHNIYIEIKPDEVGPLYLVLATAYLHKDTMPEVENRKPGTWKWIERVLEVLRKKVM